MSDKPEKLKHKSSHRHKDRSSDADREKERAERKKRRQTVANLSVENDTRSGSSLSKTELMATTVASLLRPEIEKILEEQKNEINQLRKLVETLVSRQADEMAAENKALKARVAELEKKLQKRDASADSSSSASSDDESSAESSKDSKTESSMAPKATEVLNSQPRSSPLQSLTSGRPKSASVRKPSGYAAISQSGNHVVKPATVDTGSIAASAAAGGFSIAAAAVATSTAATGSKAQSSASPAPTPTQSALADDDDLDTKDLTEDEVEAIKELFSKYDINNDGVIDRYEFELILEDLRKSDYMSNKISDGIFKKFVSANWDTLDSDKSGSVDLQEFINFVRSSKAAGNMFTKPLNLKLKKESQRNLSKLMVSRSTTPRTN
eukprot:TRINITY_DN16214_c0_g1_i1.p1 TRINITY_DN16214_c0_g1~~TRINITY_DN16214_c0_g1_i1.p1  ORF type:complete len:393 (+),score=94.14 TRINITY_DN16214_c0_g1_i1:38-1180(+)